jgi:hypothetical protein
MGASLDYRVWARRSLPAVYVGTFSDPAGMTACVFADPRSGRAIGPLNLRLGRATGYTCPAPRVGPPPAAPTGSLGLLEHYRVEWAGPSSGPDREERGVFVGFAPGPETRDLATLAADGLLLGLLALEARIAKLQDPGELERAQWGLLLARAEAAAFRQLPRLKKALPKQSYHDLSAVTALVLGGLRGLTEAPGLFWKGSWPDAFHALRKGAAVPASALAGYEVFEPGVLRRPPYISPESHVLPDPEPFAPEARDGIRFLLAAGPDVYKKALRSLKGAREVEEAIVLGFDAAGRLGVAEGGTIQVLRWCAPQPSTARFGDVIRLILQDDRVAWTEPSGRNEAAKAVDLLQAAKAEAWLARAAEEGLFSWEAWEKTAEGTEIRTSIGLNPSAEHARRLERRLPGTGTGHARLTAVLAVVAAYWRAGAFDDARILLGRLPNLLPETLDAPVLRASKRLHALLEGRHVHDASEEARNELSIVWDGTLSQIAGELGQAFSGRCAEVLENAGL